MCTTTWLQAGIVDNANNVGCRRKADEEWRLCRLNIFEAIYSVHVRSNTG